MTLKIEQILTSPEGKTLDERFPVPLKDKITVQAKIWKIRGTSRGTSRHEDHRGIIRV